MAQPDTEQLDAWRAVYVVSSCVASQLALFPHRAIALAIAQKFGFARDHVILGCGSNEIIEFIGKAFLNPGDEIVTARHAFVVYKLMATLFGATTVEVPDGTVTTEDSATRRI